VQLDEAGPSLLHLDVALDIRNGAQVEAAVALVRRVYEGRAREALEREAGADLGPQLAARLRDTVDRVAARLPGTLASVRVRLDVEKVVRPGGNAFRPGVLGYDLARLCFEGPAEQLDSTVVSQPALFVTSLAALESLKKAPFRNHRIVPGRGGVVEADSLQWLTKYLNTARRKVGQLRERKLNRSDVSRLVPEFLEYWEVPAADRRRMSARLQIGLEHLWDEQERAEAA
jgi:hypothetical protein